jgi:hypothetical protein
MKEKGNRRAPGPNEKCGWSRPRGLQTPAEGQREDERLLWRVFPFDKTIIPGDGL